MSPAFKAITSISIWVLFLVGLLALAMAFVRIIGAAAGARPPDVGLMSAYFAVGTTSLFLSVVSITLRKKLE